MKHSAKAAARIERERTRQARRDGSRRRAGKPAAGDQPPPETAATEAATAAPAGAGRLINLPYAIVLAGAVAGLVLMQVAKDAVRSGTLVIAGALLAASLTRLVLPEDRAGLLGSRRRLVDVALLTALGAGLLTAGLIVSVPG